MTAMWHYDSQNELSTNEKVGTNTSPLAQSYLRTMTVEFTRNTPKFCYKDAVVDGNRKKFCRVCIGLPLLLRE